MILDAEDEEMIEELYEKHVAAPRRALETELGRVLYDQAMRAEAEKAKAAALEDVDWSVDACRVVALADKIIAAAS